MNKQSKPIEPVVEILLKLPDVIRQCGVKRSFIYDGMEQGTFPQQIKLSKRAVAWPQSQISQWVNEKITGKK